VAWERRVKALAFDEYECLAERGGPVPVFREMPGDLHTPVSAYLAVAGRSERAFLLESVVGGERVARYSFIGRDPIGSFEIPPGDFAQPSRAGSLLPMLRSQLGPPAAEVFGLPRFTGGAVGYVSYDAVRLFENVPQRLGPGTEPLASFSLYRSVVAFDHAWQRLLLIADAPPGGRADFERAQQVLDGLEADLRRPRSVELRSTGPALAVSAREVFGDGAAFRDAVVRAQEHIAAGDIFQVVLSRQGTVPCELDPFTVYRALRMVNPSPYMYFLKDGARAVAGASPEMLVRVEGRRVEARPIAGTRPRGKDAAEDEALGLELLSDAKERAEHLMLVDLARNDLGRVCRFDSVTVPELLKLERYSHVSHLVSSVTGELAEGKDALDALVATFPAGTLSGAPKIRAMEIVDALEPARRGLYGGALGYLDLRGNLDFCIAIRTLVLQGGQATLQAGAGIVADSDPAAEERETEAKAGAMLAALSLAAEL
jgi:anthranilate synthase component 1